MARSLEAKNKKRSKKLILLYIERLTCIKERVEPVFLEVMKMIEELEELKLLAAKFKAQLEAQGTLPLYTPQELEKLELRQQQQTKTVNDNNLDNIDLANNPKLQFLEIKSNLCILHFQ